MAVLEGLLVLLIILEFLYTLFMGIFISCDDSNEFSINFIENIFKCIKMLYEDRNLFGYILSTVVCVLTIPAMLLNAFTCLVLYICYLFCRLWELGKRKTSE